MQQAFALFPTELPARARLAAVPGIGPWTIGSVAVRAPATRTRSPPTTSMSGTRHAGRACPPRPGGDRARLPLAAVARPLGRQAAGAALAQPKRSRVIP